jgi:long-subunit fatty acid transport protein
MKSTKPNGLAVLFALFGSGVASAGGLFLPGAGVVSTTRAGAAVASADDAEAIAINPAGIAKTTGTKITLGIVAIDYLMSFARAGNYDPITEEATSYAGTPFPKVTNDPKPPLGIGAYQPVPMIGIVSDLNGAVPHLHLGFGIYAPNAYPFRNMNNVNGKPYYTQTANSYDFPVFGAAPPPSRYDIIEEEAAIILPSLDVAYSITPDFDVGIRGSFGIATLKSTVNVWGTPGNYEEWNKKDGIFTLDAKDTFVKTGGLGASYRLGKNIELGANYTLPINIHAKGHAYSVNGPAATLAGAPVIVVPPPDSAARCEAGGVVGDLKGCVDVELPMTAQIGGRWKFLDAAGKQKGDIELDLDWERWGDTCDYTKDPTCQNASDFHVNIDGQATTAAMPDNGITLKPSLVQHGLQDTYAVRIGGSYNFDAGANTIVARGGIGYDTAAARPGWERADLDGAARTMISAGGSYKLQKWSFDAGFGVILEGTRTSNRNCDPTGATGSIGCSGNGDAPADGYGQGAPTRQGPDPINPIIDAGVQSEKPVNQGTFTSHYIMFMVGASTWF